MWVGLGATPTSPSFPTCPALLWLASTSTGHSLPRLRVMTCPFLKS